MTAPFLRFDFADTLGLPGPVCFAQPERVIVAHHVSEVIAALRAVEEGTQQGFYAAGYVAYEAAPAFDDAFATPERPASSASSPSTASSPSSASIPPTVSRTSSVSNAPRSASRTASSTALPLVWFGLFREPRSAALLASASSDPSSVAAASAASSAEAAANTAAASGEAGATTEWRWTPDITPDHYRAGIDAVKEAIARGDTYQVNYTFRLRAELDRDANDLEARYRRLARAQRAPYSAYLDLGRHRILSLSPELFFKTHGGRITTKPMKGTAPRGRWNEEDGRWATWLAASEKNRAENVMIVDLARNDVGRIAEIGSVRATSLCEVERYPSVFQLVSTVEGTLRARTTLTDVFGALFPAGSITGAPKSSSVRLISSIEHSPRGVYCGAIGFVTPSGDAIFNVAIRTAAIDAVSGRAEFGVGGGVTWDSTTDGEYAEALSKAACLSLPPAFDLLETMRLEAGSPTSGVIVRRERHIQRMRDSAAYLDVPFDVGRINAALDRSIADSYVARGGGGGGGSGTGSGAYRVRLLLSPEGVPRVQMTPFDQSPPASPSPLPVVLAKTPVSSQDIFLFHKTTNRAVYEAHARAIDRVAYPDAFDVLLWNESREVTEFTIGNAIVEIDGERWTPPRRCGLLGGTLRAELLERGAIRERVVTLDDLSRATRVWLINSVRGEIEVRLRPNGQITLTQPSP